MEEEEDSIAVEPSEENGNVPAEEIGAVEAPSDQSDEEKSQASEKPEATEAKTYKLPDGREVDPDTLYKEYAENLLPDYTRKSQELAKLQKGDEPSKINQAPEKPYQREDWTPESWGQVFELAKAEIRQDFEEREREQVERRKQLEDSVTNELTELKKTDPSLDENSLFLHANSYREKYGVSFPNLTAAYKHMKDVQDLTKAVQQTTVKNITKRADPVSTTAPNKATGQQVDPSGFASAVEFLRGLKS